LYWLIAASDKKAKVYREKLIGRGLCPSKVDAIISPIGKEINAQTPSEIAISILAAVTQFNNRTVDRKTLDQEKELPVKKTDAPSLDRENARALESKGSCCGG
jgi:xanthine/CO dehydrogenase XdhC/CoxF family maturation factor